MKFLLIAAVSLLAATSSCQRGRSGAGADVVGEVSSADSSSADSLAPDSLMPDAQEQIIESTVMERTADELFDDFVFNFAANRRLQMQRIEFPLPSVHLNGNTETVRREQWHMEHFFMRQDYYTLLFDNEEQMEAVSDTSVCEAVVERILLNAHTIKRFVFRRKQGLWKLTSLQNTELGASHNASFLSFYERFSTDSLFQAQHLADVIRFSAPDPDNDFETMDGVITPETWQAFVPDLPQNTIYNIVYGRQPVTESPRKLFIIRGIANDSQVELDFERRGQQWFLTALRQ
ncbi:MAG: DUF4348 domain-containing protein [Prevotella sp.]|nr:DUF4348 domain-containing protein [Prevotella sp.]